MLAAHKKIIVTGVVVMLIGVLLSSFIPALMSWGLNSGYGGTLLASVPLSFINALISNALTPFGAVLAAVGVAMHMAGAKSNV